MMYILIVVGALFILGVLAYIVSRWPEASAKKKKQKKEPPVPVVPDKDMTEAAARLERRIGGLENALQTAEKELRDKDKQIVEARAAIGGLERQVAQEKAWRAKEEALAQKEKKLEKDLRAELDKTRAALHEQSNQRIKLDYEVKELRLVKEALSADVRKFTGQNNDLDRRLKELTEEARTLKTENAQLRYKKEADQWVAKDDYITVEKLLKQARQQVEQLQKRLPAELREIEEKNL